MAKITTSSEKDSDKVFAEGDEVFAEGDVAIAPEVSFVPKEEGTILLSRATQPLQKLVVWLSPGSQPQFVDWRNWRDQARLRKPLATLVIMWAMTSA